MPLCQPEKRRAIGTNNPRKIVGVDMKSGNGRRFADIMTVLAGQYPGADATALREISSLRVALEMTTDALLGCDKRARTDRVRLSNLLSRRERKLQASLAKPKVEPPDLADYLDRARA
jgi:hypothetical protein